VFQVAAEFLFTSGWERDAIQKRLAERGIAPVLAALGMIIGGAIAGIITVVLVPQRIISTLSIRGISLALSPMITGLVMKGHGSWRENRGMKHSYFATFWGGALFAFRMALVRFLFVK
jgi:hypothetical protein